MENSTPKQRLLIELAKKGILGESIETEVDKIVKSIPEATRASYPEDKFEAAEAFMSAYYAQQGAGSATPNTAQSTSATSTPVATLPAEFVSNVKKVMGIDKKDKEERTANTVVTKLLIDKPNPSTYLKDTDTVVPVCKAEKLKEYEDKLDKNDPENLQNFETLKNAVINKTAMPIHISEGQNKVIGFYIDTPTAEAGKTSLARQILTYSAALGFVTTKVNGYIPTGSTGLGLKLRWNKPRKGSKVVNTKKSMGSPNLIIGGKKEALLNPELYEVTSTPELNGKVVVTKAGKLRTELSFRINTGEKNSNGDDIFRKIRLSGDAQVPKFIRTTEEFTKLFGNTERDRSVIAPPTAAEADELEDVVVKTIGYMSESGASQFQIGTLIDQIAAASATTSNPASDMAID